MITRNPDPPLGGSTPAAGLWPVDRNPSTTSLPCTVNAQMTNTEIATNKIACSGYQRSHANAINAINTATITLTVRAHTAPDPSPGTTAVRSSSRSAQAPGCHARRGGP